MGSGYGAKCLCRGKIHPELTKIANADRKNQVDLHDHQNHKIMKFPFAALSGVLLLLASFSLTGCSSAKAEGGDKQTVEIQTSAICGTCKQTLEKAMDKTEGVTKSRLDLGNKVLTVEYDPELTDADAIRKAVTETGYDADGIPANPVAHDNLAECCQKDSGMH